MNGITAFQLLGKLAIDGVEETKKALKEVSKGGEDAKNKLSVSFQDIGQKAGELGKSIAVGLAGAIATVTATYEATKEFRQDLGRLVAGYEGVGSSGEVANKVFKDFYGILGETDTAVEASNLLKELAKDEQGLAEWTTIATGVYSRFPDSIPVEALIESANETAKVGQITGNLADAINWASASGETFGVTLKKNTEKNKEWNEAVKSATSAEDYFNLALQQCNSEAERETLIRNTLNGLYKDSATEYQNNNQGLIDNNKAQAELNMKMAETMEKIEPLITQGKIFLAEVLLKAQPLITWIIDNINILGPIVLGFLGTLFALNIASKIQAFMPILKALFTLLKANPIGLVITAIGLLVTAFIYLWNNCEGFRKFWINLWENIKIKFNLAVGIIKAGIQNVKNFFSNLKDNVTTKINLLKDGVVNTFNKIKTAITTPIENAKEKVKGVIDKIKGFFKFNVSLPKIKLPHFAITPKGWKLGDLLEGSIPKLGIDWYAKAVRNPMLLESPTAFGLSPNGNIRVGGEAGSEIVGGTSTIMSMIGDAVSGNNYGIEEKLDRVISLLTNYLPTLGNQKVVLSTGELVGAMVNPMDRALGELAVKKGRGY